MAVRHNVTIFEDWVYVNNNEGSWVTADLSSYLDDNMGFVRIILEITEIDTDGSENVYCKIKEYNSSYKEVAISKTSTRYNSNEKGEMHCWTDDAGKIEYYIGYGWWEAKKVKVKLMLECSIC